MVSAWRGRGGGEETHQRLGREEGRLEEEIDAELRRAGGAPAAAVLHLQNREEVVRGEEETLLCLL
jgi:hypothetical protein